MSFAYLVSLLLLGSIAFALVREMRKASPRPAGLRGHIRAHGWGLLLLPVALMAAVMTGHVHALTVAELAVAGALVTWAPRLAAKQAGAVGYLLKDRVFNDDQFTGAIRTVAAGGTVLDPEVVQKLMVRHSRTEPVARLTPREREVLGLMAEGRSNAAIAQRLFITEKAVSKHAAGIFGKLDLAPSDDDNRRVLAVLAYLGS
jgi:DNA-binding CsgD family transcriptional regulator